MPTSVSSSPLPRPDAAVLLVLLPLPTSAALPEAARATACLRMLRRRLGSAVRVLQIDEASHPVVVSTFGPPSLPACVLMRRGVELWRQQGLPDDGTVEALLEAAQAG